MFSPAELAVLRTLRGSLEAIAPSLVPSIDLLLSGSLSERRSRKAVNQANLRERNRQHNDNASATQGHATATPELRVDNETASNGNALATGGKGGDLGSSLISSGSPSLPASPSRREDQTGSLLTTGEPKEPKPKARRLPEDWTPSTRLLEWSAGLGVDAAKCVEGFVDYWRARAKDNTRLDWDATFRERIRTLLEQGRAPMLPSAGGSGAPETSYDEVHNTGRWRRVTAGGKLIRSEPLDDKARETLVRQGEQQSLLGGERK